MNPLPEKAVRMVRATIRPVFVFDEREHLVGQATHFANQAPDVFNVRVAHDGLPPSAYSLRPPRTAW